MIRLLDWIIDRIDQLTAALLATVSSDEPAVDDALEALEALDFPTACSAGPRGDLIVLHAPCPNPAALAVTIDGAAPGERYGETWCQRCYTAYLTVLRTAYPDPVISAHVRAEQL